MRYRSQTSRILCRGGLAMDEDAIARVVIDSAFKIHTALGPGLLESVYEACIKYELNRRQLLVQTQVPIIVKYADAVLGIGYRIDLLIERKLVVEVKCAEHSHPLHRAQLLSYLKLGQFKLGLLLNFNPIHMRHGIKRVVSGL